MNTVLTLAILCLVLSVIIYIFLDRRKFYRRNQSGVETFSSYSNSVFTRVGEKMLRLLALILFLCGAVLFAVWYFG